MKNKFFNKKFENILNLPKHLRNVYWGIDPTSNRLTLGHIKCLMGLIELQEDYDVFIYILIGDYTVKHGDPSDKNQARTIDYDLSENISSLTKSIERILKNYRYSIIYNSEWLEKITLTELNELYNDVSINSMLKYSYINKRITNNNYLPFREFIYSLLQGYDFYHLRVTKNITIQYGAQDQYINMLQGIKLCNKMGIEHSYSITVPLLVNEKGEKFSKTSAIDTTIMSNTVPFEFRVALSNLSDGVLNSILNTVYDTNISISNKINIRNNNIYQILKFVFPGSYKEAYIYRAKCDNYRQIFGLVLNKSNRWVKENVVILHETNRTITIKVRNNKLVVIKSAC